MTGLNALLYEAIELVILNWRCCPPLQVTPTNSNLANGIMTFTYNNDVCRTSVVANCSQPAIPLLNLMAGIVANQVTFLAIDTTTVTFPGTCNANLRWEMGTPPLVIDSIQCVLSNVAATATYFESELLRRMPYKINRFYFLAFLTWQFCILYVTQQIFGIFANYTPKWRCDANETFNSDCDVFAACEGGVEFEEAYVAALYNQLSFFGVLVGTFSFGALSDAVGRRPMAILALCASILSTLFSGLAPSWQLLLLSRFFVGLCCGGHVVGIYTYIMELLLPEQRMGNARIIFTVVCYIFPHWRSASIAYSFLVVPPLLIVLFVLPESPMWLHSKGRLDAMRASEKKMARIAGVKYVVQERKPQQRSQKFTDIIRNPHYSKRLLVLWIMWFTASLCSYATDLNSSRISGNLFLNQMLFGVMLAISKVLLVTLDTLRPSFNRRRLHQYAQLSVCMCFFMLTILLLFGYKGVAILVINLAGTVFNEYTWDACYLCAVEAMPTGMRASSLGSCSLIARVGALLSPTLYFLGTIWPPSPYLGVFILGSLNLINSCAFLVDTKGVNMDNVEMGVDGANEELCTTDRFTKQFNDEKSEDSHQDDIRN
uniref:Major facilitator superfamily (MFS) profile domain-containing protein n=1 Tax=Ascaris lumbricoides TaxID=6252 RepID=A0A9J2PBM4_ASCLU